MVTHRTIERPYGQTTQFVNDGQVVATRVGDHVTIQTNDGLITKNRVLQTEQGPYTLSDNEIDTYLEARCAA